MCTPTTEIYTYGHTLALHDALPILTALVGRIKRERPGVPVIVFPRGAGDDDDRLDRFDPERTERGRGVDFPDIGRRHLLQDGLEPLVQPSKCRQRSEEHTSELQSLMRISYAVFCLKKKNKKN